MKWRFGHVTNSVHIRACVDQALRAIRIVPPHHHQQGRVAVNIRAVDAYWALPISAGNKVSEHDARFSSRVRRFLRRFGMSVSG